MGDNGYNPETNLNTDAKKRSHLNPGSLEGMFDTPEHPDSTKLLFQVSGDLPEQALRGCMPSNGFALAFAMTCGKCIENEYPEGLMMVKTFAAGIAGKGGSRARLFSDTIIGEKHSSSREGFSDRVKGFFGGGE